jgi:hypothetical protein
MAMLDFTWLAYYMAIFGFLFVTILVFALLAKTKLLGDSAWINLFVSFIFAIIFITFSPGVNYVQAIVPWFVILIVCLFLFMLMVGFSQKEVDKFMKPWISWVFVILLIIIFLIAAIKVFNPILAPYLPGSSGAGADSTLLIVTNFLFSERFLGALLLLIVAAVASWVLTKKGK